MGWFKSLFQKNNNKEASKGTAYTLRQGKSVPVDNAFNAWTSGDLNEMLKVLKAVDTKTNPIDTSCCSRLLRQLTN